MKPNILFIMADQLRWDTVGSLGTWVNTPNLDALAAEGVMFNNCIANAPVCCPARVALATGKYPHNFGTWHNSGYDLPGKAPNWMKVIRNQGYRTSLFGKIHLHKNKTKDLRDYEHLVREYGFDDINETVGPRACVMVTSHMTEHWRNLGLLDQFKADIVYRLQEDPYLVRPSSLPLEHYYDVYIASRAGEYLQSYNHDKPWFCKLSFTGPHEPWDAPEPYASMYKPELMPAPVNTIDHPGGISELSDRLQSGKRASLEQTLAMRANYAGNVSLIDDQIGRVFDIIKARGEWDNTVIVFTADHGEMNGDHGLFYKNTFLNGAIRVPLIVRLPEAMWGYAAGSALNNPVELMDVGSTLAEFAGGSLRYHQFARSFAELVNDMASGGKSARDSALAEFKGEFMLLTERYKLAVNRQGAPYLLVDQIKDAHEQHNLVTEPDCAPVLQELQVRLLERIISSQSYQPPKTQ